MRAPSSTGVRLALLSTPRSGNTWLRHLLAQLFAAEELAVHHPDEVRWPTLPRDCILQLHWQRTAALEAQLVEHGFRVVVLARHPLDVLLSILHFATHDGATRHWLQGEAGDEKPLHGAMPCSASFLEYGQGLRARALLAVSTQWCEAPGALTLTYEALVANPCAQLGRMVQAFNIPAQRSVADTVAAATLPRMRGLNGAIHHFWQGHPGLWRRLVVADIAEDIAAAQAEPFHRFGYRCDPDRQLTRRQADALWIDLNRDELTEKTWHYAATRRTLEAAQAQLLEMQRRMAAADRALEAAEIRLRPQELDRATHFLATARQELAAARDAREEGSAPWTGRFLRIGRALARKAHRVWGRV
jgi:hypothetical protein